jgi:hypothetical protein
MVQVKMGAKMQTRLDNKLYQFRNPTQHVIFESIWQAGGLLSLFVALRYEGEFSFFSGAKDPQLLTNLTLVMSIAALVILVKETSRPLARKYDLVPENRNVELPVLYRSSGTIFAFGLSMWGASALVGGCFLLMGVGILLHYAKKREDWIKYHMKPISNLGQLTDIAIDHQTGLGQKQVNGLGL